MAFDPDETRRRLDEVLARAAEASPDLPIDPQAPVIRARRAIRVRYTLLTAAFVVLTIVLTAGAVVARDRLDDPGPTGPTDTGATGSTATGSTDTGPAPVATITSGPQPGELTTVAETTFGFTIEPPGNAVCTLNQGPPEPCESPTTVTAREDGNTFTVRGVDAQGREGKPARRTWTLDTIDPTVDLQSVDLVFAQLLDNIMCFVDGQQQPSCTAPVEGLSGQHEFLVRLPAAWDFTWTLTSTPSTVRFLGTGNTETPTTSTVSFTFEQSEPGPTKCRVGESETPCEGGILVDTLTDDDLGSVTDSIEITPVDQAGNETLPTQFFVTFDANNTEVV
jgi:hypothetical protein